jgi:hypothetical protein
LPTPARIFCSISSAAIGSFERVIRAYATDGSALRRNGSGPSFDSSSRCSATFSTSQRVGPRRSVQCVSPTIRIRT